MTVREINSTERHPFIELANHAALACRSRLQVNIVPVIAKADTLTPDELVVLKEQLMHDFAREQIQIFTPTVETDGNANPAEQPTEAERLAAAVPFAVVGSNLLHQVPWTRLCLGRTYAGFGS